MNAVEFMSTALPLEDAPSFSLGVAPLSEETALGFAVFGNDQLAAVGSTEALNVGTVDDLLAR